MFSITSVTLILVVIRILPLQLYKNAFLWLFMEIVIHNNMRRQVECKLCFHRYLTPNHRRCAWKTRFGFSRFLQRLARGRPPAHRARSSWRLWVLQLEGGEWEDSDAKAVLHGSDRSLTEAGRAILRKKKTQKNMSSSSNRRHFSVRKESKSGSAAGLAVPCKHGEV